jgi:hypothetical protein
MGAKSGGPFRNGEVIAGLENPSWLPELTAACRQNHQTDVCLGVAVIPAGDRQEVHLVLITPDQQDEFTRPYGGPPEYAPRWAAHHSLDILRKIGSGKQ